MITDQVIHTIYSSFKKPEKCEENLNLPYFIELLSPHHKIKVEDGEVILADLEEFNPFRCFLVRSLHTVLEFDRMVAFVFSGHILFLSKESEKMRVHIKPEKPKSIFKRLFSRSE